MGIFSDPIGGQLDAVATERACTLDRLAHQRGTDAAASMLGLHVDGLDLGAETASPLEVTEHDELADAHDLTAELSHQDRAHALVDLAEG
jgi:hypothetical protein